MTKPEDINPAGGKAVPHRLALMEHPTTWAPNYDAEDKEAVCHIIDWINAGQTHAPGYANQRNQTKLARATGIAQGTLNPILLGKYVSSPKKQLATLLDYIGRESARAANVQVPFVPTSVHQTVEFVCKRAHQYRDVGIVSGEVGVGKTTAVKRYAATTPNVLLVEGSPDMNAIVLLRELVDLTGAVVQKSNRYAVGTKSEMFRAIVKALRGTDKLLVLDEADKVADSALEYARRISDIAEIGLVLVGTEKLRPMVEDPRGKHGQISSRVGFWPAVIKSIKREDALMIVRAAFDGRDAPNEEILDAFWQMCDGRARVLAKLLRNVIELCLDQGHDLTPRLVFEAGQQLMGLKRPKGV